MHPLVDRVTMYLPRIPAMRNELYRLVRVGAATRRTAIALDGDALAALERIGTAGIAAMSLPELAAAVWTRRRGSRPLSVTLTKRLDKGFGSIYDRHRGKLISFGG